MENIKQYSIKTNKIKSMVGEPQTIIKDNIKSKDEFLDNKYEKQIDTFYSDSFIESIL